MLHQELILTPKASQISMIASEILYKGTINNHHNALAEIKGPIDQAIFEKALHAVANRHIILHAKLGENDEGRPVLKIITDAERRKKNISFKLIDARELPNIPGYSPKLLDLYDNLKLINEEGLIKSPFNLREGPLWRAALIKIDTHHYQFLMIFNHIIIDGQSVSIIFEDLSSYYNAYLHEKEPVLPHLPDITALDLSLKPEIFQERLNYWKEKLQDLNPLSLQTDYLPQKSFRFLGKRIRFNLEKTLIDSIEKNQTLSRITLNQRLFAALFVLLHRYSGQTNICVGIPSANRRLEHINPEVMKRLVNCFMNSVPIRLDFSKDCTFAELLTLLNQTLSEGLKHQLPIDQIYQKALTVETKSKLNIASPFSILWGMNEENREFTLEGTTPASYVNLGSGQSKFTHFGINIDLHKNGADCFIEYNLDLFSEATMTRLIGHLKNIMAYSATHPDCKISEIPFLLEEERVLILDYNHTNQVLPFTGCVHEFFTEQAKKYPDHHAVSFHHKDQTVEKLSYAALDWTSTKLAFHLIQLKVKRNQPVGVCLARSPKLLVAMLGIMKAGAVFVPMENVESALKAIDHKIETTQLTLVITDNSTTPLFANKKLDIFNINALSEMEVTESSLPNVLLTDPVHIMFTSGSSGETPMPKGVINTHEGLSNLLCDLILQNKDPKEENLIGTAPYDFDAFIYDFLKALALLTLGKAGELHLVGDAGRYSPSEINRIIAQEKINFGVFLPRQLALLTPNPSLKRIISMGEPPLDATIAKWKAANPSIEFENGFGVTEASICLSTYPLTEGGDSGLIGKPIINMQKHILDENLRPCPIGVSGELYVSGPGVAMGYLGHPELTQAKFFSLLFDEQEFIFKKCEAQKGQRFYKTGDYGCYVLTPKGLVIKYQGRLDRQIKLQGVRIDTNAITSILCKSDLVQDVVLVPNQNKTSLIAYIVLKTAEIDFQKVKKQIFAELKSTSLPRIAYPHTIIEMKSLPYTPNGKVDLRKLPIPIGSQKPEVSLSSDIIPNEKLLKTKYQAASKMQSILQELWAEILEKPKNKIAINKTFGKLGGSSYTLAMFEILINASKKQLDLQENCYIGINILSEEMTIESLELDLKPFLNVKSLSVISPLNSVFRNNNIVLFPPPAKPQVLQPSTISSDASSNQTLKNLRLTKNSE